MKRQFVRSIFIILVSAMLLTIMVGVAGGQDEQRVLRLAYTQEPPILFDYFSDLGVAWNLMRIHSLPPWGRDGTGTVLPTLVDELPSEENGGIVHTDEGKTIVSFTLADWAVWSDGTPITAADFELVFDVSKDGLSNMLEFRFVNGAALDSVTQGETEKDVVITFSFLQPDWTTATFVPLPNHLLREDYEAVLAENRGMDTMEWLRAPVVSNGPFVFAEWDSGSFIRYERNENYWGDVWFDEVVISFYPDETVVKQLLVNGETDWTLAIPPLEAEELVAENPDTLALYTGFTGGRMELRFNQGPNAHPAMRDSRVRRALSMAVDRQFIVDELYDGNTAIPRSFWDGTPWFHEDTPQIAYDPEGALAQLREAGWYDDGSGSIASHGVEGVEDGTELALTSATYAGGGFTQYQDVLLVIQDMLSDIDIDMTITHYAVNVIHAPFSTDSPYATGKHDMYIQGWGVGTSTIDQLELWSCASIPSEENDTGWNGIHACYPEMDDLWDVLGTALDADERQEAANRIQTLMAEESFTLFVVNLLPALTFNASLENVSWAVTDTPWYSLPEWKSAE
jgi:peptide/nickel transport system substrate-binding protein